MSIELSEVYRLRKGDGSTFAGRLAQEGVDYLSASTNTVMVTGERLRHFQDRDRRMSDLEVITMGYGLIYGLFIGNPARPNHLVISYEFPDTGFRYKLVVNSARNSAELWIATMHKLKKRQTMALLKGCKIVRCAK